MSTFEFRIRRERRADADVGWGPGWSVYASTYEFEELCRALARWCCFQRSFWKFFTDFEASLQLGSLIVDTIWCKCSSLMCNGKWFSDQEMLENWKVLHIKARAQNESFHNFPLRIIVYRFFARIAESFPFHPAITFSARLRAFSFHTPSPSAQFRVTPLKPALSSPCPPEFARESLWKSVKKLFVLLCKQSTDNFPQSFLLFWISRVRVEADQLSRVHP